jgi:hypothetical protein
MSTPLPLLCKVNYAVRVKTIMPLRQSLTRSSFFFMCAIMGIMLLVGSQLRREPG